MTPAEIYWMVRSEVEHQRDVNARQFGELLVRLARAMDPMGDQTRNELLAEAAEIEHDLLGDWTNTRKLAEAFDPQRAINKGRS